jgi:hypothetical protein
MSKKFSVLLSVVAAAALCPCALADLRVDINPTSDRKDILTRSMINMPIREGGETTQRFGALTVTLRPWGPGVTLDGQLVKAGLDTGATMSTDAAIVHGGTGNGGIEMVLSGLSPGRHSIATYHNAINAQPATGALNVAIRDQNLKALVTPTHRVKNDEDAASAYLAFNAEAGKDVVVTIDSATGNSADIFLNGFEIDAPNPARRALKPSPANDDEHVVENPTLRWQAPATAISHDFYFGTDAQAVATATHQSPEFKGNQKKAEYVPTNLDSWTTYYWRVDEVNSDAPQSPIHGDLWSFRPRHLAFPTAEGYGRFAIGGRGGKVYEVTTLEDGGPGSLREAVEASGPRTIVFRVGGTIELKRKLIVSHPYCTIAGQTAPGDGILLKGFTSAAGGTHDVILRYLRIRVGDESGQTLDGSGLGGCDNAITDHCSISWSIDEAFSSRGAKNITLQRSIISEPLNMSVHSHYVGTGKGHSFAGSISGNIGSFHHNLLVNCAGRNWSLAGGLTQGGEFDGDLDIRNNVVYNWVHRTTDGGVKRLDYVGNYYIPGPATTFLHLLDPDAGIHTKTPDDFQRIYMAGNRMEGHPEFDNDNWKGALLRSEKDGGPGTGAGLARIKIANPMFESYVKTESALDAYKSVVADVGANIPHYDSVDRRAIDDVTHRTTHTVGSKTGFKGIIDSQKDAGGYPVLKGGDAPKDSDHDGIPDSWESAHGLKADDPADGARPAKDGSGYSNLEEYLNGIRPDGTNQ